MNIVRSNDESVLEFIRSLGIETPRLAKVTIIIEVGKPVMIETISYSKELKMPENHVYQLYESTVEDLSGYTPMIDNTNPIPPDSGSQV
jgi:hypothetical protein